MITSKAHITINTIDEYIANFSEDIQHLLEQIRKTIQKAAPEATESIGYQMPTFKLNGNLVYFAAYKKHIEFYPTSTGITAFKQELAAYKHAKGSVQFPINQPIPYHLISQIVQYRVKENLNKKTNISTPKSNSKNQNDFLSTIPQPARKALEEAGINTLHQLTQLSEKDLLQLQGISTNTLKKLKNELTGKGLALFKND